MSSRRFCAAVLSIAVLLLVSSYLHAPSTYGSISGTVTDQSGAAVAGAPVTLTNVGTAEMRSETSGDDGHFTFVNLFPGKDRIDIEKQGFKHFGHPGVIVQVQQDTHVDAALTVGQVTETVEVTSETLLLPWPKADRVVRLWDRIHSAGATIRSEVRSRTRERNISTASR